MEDQIFQEGDLRYELEYFYEEGRFTRGPKCVDSEGRIYFPLDLTKEKGTTWMNIDVGGTERVVLLRAHLDDQVLEIN